MQIQKEVVDALLAPDAYPKDAGKIELIQTHISFVFLTKNYVYKVKKVVNFGFLDFSTKGAPSARKSLSLTGASAQKYTSKSSPSQNQRASR